MKSLKLLTLLAALGSVFFFVGCKDNNLEDAADEVGDAMEDGAEATKDAVNEGADAVKDATN
jgi:hypothetical protein